ncbi:4'-phosphopantetheinyl transferase superfamily [Lipomyces oligophaga]|uniref:4'-phosphopantetheinyl transferase superfamily n=1 Tax=Lipomyces oligophaga TaxID=45792 RepID=UPI0034CD7A55
MSVRNVGIDILFLPRITNLMSKEINSRKFPLRILHPVEYEFYERLPDHRWDSLNKRIRFLARCWSVKEALFKSLDNSRQQHFEFKEWCTVSENMTEKPAAPSITSPHMEDETFKVSLSHDGEYITAIVLRLQG